jgi:hypothetical protein
VSGLERRLADLEGRLAPGCPGPPIEFYQGTRAELDALELPEDCRLCGRPMSEHAPVPRYIFVLTDACGEADRDNDGGLSDGKGA